MKKVVLMLAIQLSILATNCVSQSSQWKYYYCIEGVSGMAEDNNNMWITTANGLFKIDKITDNIINDYHTWNSQIPSNSNGPIIKDKKGNLWISNVGLVKYDGKNWTLYNQDDSVLYINGVTALTQDSIGNIWIGEFNGDLLKLEDSVWNTYNDSSNQLEGVITSIAVDKSGNIWITGDEGAEKFDGVNWTIFNTVNSGLPTNLINSVSIDKLGKKWFDLGEGIVEFNDTTWTLYDSFTAGLPINTGGSVIIDKKDNKWIATNNGAYEFNDNTQEWNLIYDTSDTKGGLSYFDSENNPWFSYSDGVIKFDGTNWHTFRLSNSGLVDNEILSLLIDKKGNKWIATRSGGLTKFDGVNWTTYNTSNSGLTENYITGLCADKLGNIWIATNDSGVCKFDGKNWTTYWSINPPNIILCQSCLPENNIDAIDIDSLGNIWVGTTDNGAGKYDGTNWTTYNDINNYFGYSEISVTCMYIDKQNKKYFGTQIGIVTYNDTIWNIYNPDTSTPGLLAENYITSLLIDNKNNLWAGTEFGVEKFKDNNLNKFIVCDTGNTSLPNNNVLSLMEDNIGNVWFGTANGAAMLDGNNWNVYSIIKSYPNDYENYILSLSSDSIGNIWFGTGGAGLVIYNENGIILNTPEKKKNLSQESIKIYPNPASQNIIVEVKSQHINNYNIEIIDLLGNILYSSKSNQNRNDINISNYTNGIYFVRVNTGDFVESGKIIINH